MNNSISPIIAGLLIAVSIVGSAAFVQAQLSPIAERYTKNAAIDGCYQAARVATLESGADEEEDASQQTVTIPEQSWYVNCMNEKGYSVEE